MKRNPRTTPITAEQASIIQAAIADLVGVARTRAYQTMYMKFWRAANRETDRERSRRAMARWRKNHPAKSRTSAAGRLRKASSAAAGDD